MDLHGIRRPSSQRQVEGRIKCTARAAGLGEGQKGDRGTNQKNEISPANLVVIYWYILLNGALTCLNRPTCGTLGISARNGVFHQPEFWKVGIDHAFSHKNWRFLATHIRG